MTRARATEARNGGAHCCVVMTGRSSATEASRVHVEVGCHSGSAAATDLQQVGAGWRAREPDQEMCMQSTLPGCANVCAIMAHTCVSLFTPRSRALLRSSERRLGLIDCDGPFGSRKSLHATLNLQRNVARRCAVIHRACRSNGRKSRAHYRCHPPLLRDGGWDQSRGRR